MVKNSFAKKRMAWLNALTEAGVFAPAFELSEIIAFAAGISKEQQLFCTELTEAQAEAAEAVMARRVSGEPLQYIIGSWSFYGLDFYVGEGVLIPRPDTEALVDTALRLCGGQASLRIADICSGSGCIAIAIAHELPSAAVTAVELLPAAYAYLLKNIALNSALNVTPVAADALKPCLPGDALYDMIVSNPPYIRTDELAGLQREVKREPGTALDGGEDGLLFYGAILRHNKSRLKKGGWFVFEVGDTQSGQVADLMEEYGCCEISAQKDSAGFNRVVYGRIT